MPLTTDVNLNSLESILREYLVKEVKAKLLELIDSELESISRDAVIRFLQFEVEKGHSTQTLQDEYYFKFVQNITRTITKPVVVKDRKC